MCSPRDSTDTEASKSIMSTLVPVLNTVVSQAVTVAEHTVTETPGTVAMKDAHPTNAR